MSAALVAGSIAIELDTLDKGFESGLKKASGAVEHLEDKANNLANKGLKSLSSGFEAVGDLVKTSLVVGIGAVVGSIGLATKASVDFNSEMANIASLMPNSIERVNELKSSVQDMAVKLGKSTSDISGGLYQTVSAFGDTADTVKILEINAKSATAGLAKTTDAINLTSAVTKAYGDTTAKAVEKASDLALMTVRLGQTTFPELAGSVGRVTPLMKQLGGSQEELFAVMATMTGVTGGAAEVSTQLSGALQSVMAPTKDTTALMKKLGFANGEAMVKSLGVQGSLKAMVDEAKKSGKPLQSFVSSIEGQILALGLAGPQAEDFKNKLKSMGEAAGATDAAFNEQTKGVNSLGFMMTQLQQRVVVLQQQLGDGLAPVLSIIVGRLVDFASSIDIDQIVGFSTELIELITTGENESGDYLFHWLGKNMKAFQEFGAEIYRLKGIVMDFFANWSTHMINIQNTFKPVYDFLKPSFDALWLAISDMIPALQKLWNIISPVIIPVLELMGKVIGVVLIVAVKMLVDNLTILTNTTTAFANVTSEKIEFLIGLWDRYGGNIRTIFGGVMEWFRGWIDIFVGVFTGDKGKVEQGFNTMLSGVSGIFKGVMDAAGKVVYDTINWIVSFVTEKFEWLKGKASEMANLVNNIKNSATNQISQSTGASPQAVNTVGKGILNGLVPFAGLFSNGGVVGGNSANGDNILARVNSNEMILNDGQQARLFDMANGGGANSGGMGNLTVNLNGNYLGTERDKRQLARDFKDAFTSIILENKTA